MKTLTIERTNDEPPHFVSTKKFEMNDRCYLSDGTVAYFMAYLGDGDECLVSIICCNENYTTYEPNFKDVYIKVARVFSSPPEYEMVKEITEAKKELEQLLEKQSKARQSLIEIEQSCQDRRKALAKWDGFQLLEAFLEKRITHLVFVNYSTVKIMTFEEGMAYRNDFGRTKGIKLLSLFGKSDGCLEWQLNEYYDGSGSHIQVYPARSLEEAIEQCRKFFYEHMDEALADTNKTYLVNNWLPMAKAYGFNIPEELLKRDKELKIKNATENLDKAKKDLATKEAALLEIQNSL